MTREERQLRAWVRMVFCHAAIRWLDKQRRHEAVVVPMGTQEEVIAWKRDCIGC